MDAVTITRLIVPVRIGWEAAERVESQRIRIDLIIKTDFTELLATGDFGSGIDYSVVRRTVKEIAASGEFVLLENLGDMILAAVFQDKKASAAKVTIRKLDRWNDAVPGIVMERRNS